MEVVYTPHKGGRLQRFKTEHKSTENSESFSQPELQLAIRQLNRQALPKEIYSTVLSRVLYRLALSPTDLLPVLREDVELSSKAQLKQLLKEDVDFYLDSKCKKLELRRQGLLAEVAKEYQQTEKLHTLTGNFLSSPSSNHPSNRPTNRYDYPEEDGTTMARNENRRLRVLKKLRIQERSDSDVRLQMREEFNRKFSEAESRRNQYRSYVESLRSSPTLSLERHKRRLERSQEQLQERTSVLRDQLMSKLERATQSRQSRRRKLEESLHRSNQRKQRRSKSIKQSIQIADLEVREYMKTELEEDLQVHLRKKEMLMGRHIKDLKIRRNRQERKVEAIRVELQRRHESEEREAAQRLHQRQLQAEQKKQQQRERQLQQLRNRQHEKNGQIDQIYRKRSLAELKNQKRRMELLRYRKETEALVSQRRHSFEVEARHNHILQHIKMQLSLMNVHRHRRLEQLKVEKVKQELSIVDQRHRLYEDRRQSMANNRQRLRMVFLRRKHNLEQYFCSRTKDFSSGLSSSMQVSMNKRGIERSPSPVSNEHMLTLQPSDSAPRKNDSS